jgi:PAS domain S-box-containing protein
MEENGFKGQRDELHTRITAIRDKAAHLPPEQLELFSQLLNDVSVLISEENDDINSKINPSLIENEMDEWDLLDEIPCLIWRSGMDAKCKFFNRSWLAFTGRSIEQENGDGWTVGVHPDDIHQVLNTYLDAFAARQPFEVQYRLRHHSGEYRWIMDYGRPVHDRLSNFTGYLGTCFDLTGQKQMESALEASEAKFRGLFDFAPDALVAVDQHGKIIHLNKQVEQLFGYRPQELMNQPVEMLMPGQFTQRHRQHVSNFMAAPAVRPMGRLLELFAQRSDGTTFPVDITLGPLDTSDGPIVLAAIRDRTEQKISEETLRERDKLIQTALATSSIIFFTIDKNGIIRFSAGPSPLRQRGIETIGQSIYDVYHDEITVIENYERALAGEAFTTAYYIGEVDYIVSYAPLLNEQSEISGVVGVATDVTAYRRVEDELRNSQARFRAIFDQAHVGMALIDMQGRVVESNTAFEQMLGRKTVELHQKRYIDFVHPADAPAMRTALHGLFSGENTHMNIEARYVRQDRETVWGYTLLSLIHPEDGHPQYAICLVENITYQKQIRAELDEVQRRLIDSREVERLHLSQELHDGPLQELQSINFVLTELENNAVEQEPVDRAQVEQAQESLYEVTKALRVICGDLRPPALAPFGLEKAIRSFLNQSVELNPELEFMANLQEDGQILPEHIRLALFRILQHTLKNTIKHAQASQVHVIFSFDEEQIFLEIRDNGRGFRVPRRWIELVREGHFGLVGANERARAVGGKFTIKSEPGNGTTVRVVVPRSETNNTEPAGPVSPLILS